ncbi:hypothetical protein BXY66_3130 [Shimia isoporae]|uniref:Uncharacterized protein n=1 Tax=Shimia isoporae TaxID=647720 RepID=A0A4R1N6U1_9RHOB|nr:hypothetical protein [Shimia isoporae]TCL00487.1 hypothetical protein BXY66_3130 [Shimia isoporae]
MTRLKTLVFAVLTLCASPLAAQQVFECDWRARADSIVEPWDENSRSFANGDVRIALLDTIEPAGGAYHFLVLSPPYDEVGGRQCRVLSLDEGLGFAGVDFSTLEASYDPSVGLVFLVDVGLYDGETGTSKPQRLVFTLNQSTGGIGAFWP